MTELKTLKDLKATEWNKTEDKKLGDWVKVEELKQLVIKWIHIIEDKTIVINKLESEPQSPFQKVATNGLVDILEGQKKVLMDLHNITKEDLK